MKNLFKLLIVCLSFCLVQSTTVSWDYCITQKTNPCPNACIMAGYIRDQKTNLCTPPTYQFCYGQTGTCNSNSPNYYLQACIDYGFKNNTTTEKCDPPTCIDGVNPCITTTTYCADQNYTNVNNICACSIPKRDWQGQCTDILSSMKLIGFFALVVIICFFFF